MNIILRKATDNDSETIIDFIKKLSEFEKMTDSCNIKTEDLIQLMNEPNGVNAVIAECNGKAVGMMLYYFFRIATFSGKRVLYIEDIFIDENMRRNGIGNMFFDKAKEIAAKENCSRLEWKCLEWNKNAIAFYEKIGGKISDGWLTYTIEIENF